jgi:glycolate oxidase FAD binding subunit
VELCNRLSAQPIPLAGAAWADGRLWLRLEGSPGGVEAARQRLGGSPGDGAFWEDLRHQRLAFFSGDLPLWRLALPPTAPPVALPGAQLVDWGGAQRWLRTEASAESVREAVARLGGHATLFRGPDREGDVFHPLPTPLARLHQRLKEAFDPHCILNRGRMHVSH